MPQSLHKALPSTTLHYKTSTKYFPVLICTTKLAQGVLPSTTFSAKLAQSTSQHNFVLQSIHKIRPSTTLCCEVCSQYCFVLQQNLHNILTSTTVYYKASTFQYSFVLQGLRREYFTLVFTVRAFTQRFLTDTLFSTGRFYTEVFTHRNFYTQSKLLRKIRWELTIATFTIHDFQLHKTLVLRRQPQQRGTLMQPVQIDLLILSCKAP